MNNEDKILSMLEKHGTMLEKHGTMLETLVIEQQKTNQRLNILEQDVSEIKTSVNKLEQDVTIIKADVKHVKSQLRYAWEDIGNLDERTVKLEKV